MDQENFEYQQLSREKGNNLMIPERRDLVFDFDKIHEELREWNEKRPGYMQGTQEQIIALHSGRLGNAFEFLEDGEHDEDIRQAIGEKDQKRFWELRNGFVDAGEQAHRVPWHETPEGEELLRILVRIAEHPNFEKYIMRGVEKNQMGH